VKTSMYPGFVDTLYY